LVARIGIPMTGSRRSMTPRRLMFVPHWNWTTASSLFFGVASRLDDGLFLASTPRH
jgi:hypothetical protein